MYRVEYTPYPDRPRTFLRYYPTLAEARDAARTYVGHHARVLRGSVTLRYHHSATQRGYIAVSQHLLQETYSGRFGQGIIIHHANLRTPAHGLSFSRTYHAVSYYIQS